MSRSVAPSVAALASITGVTPGSISGRAASLRAASVVTSSGTTGMRAAAGVEVVQVECGVLRGVPVPCGVAAAVAQGAGDDGARHQHDGVDAAAQPGRRQSGRTVQGPGGIMAAWQGDEAKD